MRFKFVAVGRWAGMSQEAIEADIRRAQERARYGPDPDKVEVVPDELNDEDER